MIEILRELKQFNNDFERDTSCTVKLPLGCFFQLERELEEITKFDRIGDLGKVKKMVVYGIKVEIEE